MSNLSGQQSVLERKFSKGNPHLAELLRASIEGNLCIRVTGNVPEHHAVHLDGDRLYLKRNWDAETRILEGIAKLAADPIAPPQIEGLLPEQQAAIDRACQLPLSFITGGPGTGKSFTARKLIEALSAQAVAPTGKAASHLGGKTIHALLGGRIESNAILIDEASMVDVDLMVRLLEKIKPGTRLILMGDAAQLPPVEAGSLFADLVQALPDAVTKLTRPMRAETDALIDLAENLSFEALAPFRVNGDPIDYAKGATLLTPLSREVERINQALLTDPMPIMITKNAYHLDLFNGQVGTLHGEEAHFDDRTIPKAQLPPYQPAFCLSVHKSQGSEFDHVLFYAPPGSERFGKELLYTAVTRAKKSLKIISTDAVLTAMLEKQEARLSGIIDRLKSGA